MIIHSHFVHSDYNPVTFSRIKPMYVPVFIYSVETASRHRDLKRRKSLMRNLRHPIFLLLLVELSISFNRALGNNISRFMSSDL